MSNSTVKISQLPVALTVQPDDVVPIDQDGVTKRATMAQIQSASLSIYSLLTVNPEPSLTLSRQLTATGGLSLTDNGPGTTLEINTLGLLNSLSALGASGIIVNNGGVAQVRTLVQPAQGITITNPDGTTGNPTFALANDLLALESLPFTGFATRIAPDTWAQRGLVAPLEGFIIVDPAGVAGDPTFVLTDDLAALEALVGVGIAVRAAPSTWVQRVVAGTVNEITVTNGSGVAGDPTISLPAALTFTGKTVTGGTFAGATLTDPTITVLDSKFTVQDNVDPTKQFRFQASSIPTATTREYIVPSVNDTLAGILDATALAAILG